MMSRIKIWLHAARLRTLPLSLSGIIFGSFVAYNDNIFNKTIFILALLTTLFFQILSNFANDLGDTLKGADNANRVGPTRAVQSGGISISGMKIAVGLTSILAFVSSISLIYISAIGKDFSFWLFYIVLALFCIFAAITYTIGKKAYGYLGLGDVFVFIFFGFVSVIGVYHLFPAQLSLETVEWKLLLPALTIGALSTAVLNLNNMRDCENDEKVGKLTLVVKIGQKKAKIYHTFLILSAIASLLVYLLFFQKSTLFFSSLGLPILILLVHIRKVWNVQEDKAFDPFLKTVALTTFLISILFALSSILSVCYDLN